MRDLLLDSVGDVRAAAIEALASLGDSASLPFLTALKNDVCPSVRVAAGRAMVQMTTQKSAEQELAEILKGAF